MAIFHLTRNGVAPSRGASAVKASAYLSGDALARDLTGEVCRFARAERVAASGIMLPEGAPELGRAELWNAAEAAFDGARMRTVAHRENGALPRELAGDLEAMRKIVESYLKADVEAGRAVDWAIHAPTDGGDNWHFHALISDARLGADGFEVPRASSTKSYLCRKDGSDVYVLAADWPAAKTSGYEKVFNFKDGARRTMSEARAEGLGTADRKSKNPVSVHVLPDGAPAYDAERAALMGRRKRLEDCVNAALAEAGRAERVDCRSNAARGLDAAPTLHEGPKVRAVEKDALERAEAAGVPYEPVTDRRRENVAIHAFNQAVATVRKARGDGAARPWWQRMTGPVADRRRRSYAMEDADAAWSQSMWQML